MSLLAFFPGSNRQGSPCVKACSPNTSINLPWILEQSFNFRKTFVFVDSYSCGEFCLLRLFFIRNGRRLRSRMK